jgi:hypothetical protein
MDKLIPNDVLTRELLDLLDETFEHTQGIFLDRGHSSFETLEEVSADEASRWSQPEEQALQATLSTHAITPDCWKAAY